MAVLNQKSVLDMIKEFRKNWRALCNSERTTLCGADSMLLALQLSMAENNKQHSESPGWADRFNPEVQDQPGQHGKTSCLQKNTKISQVWWSASVVPATWEAEHSGEFTVSLSDVLLTWKYLLHEKLNLPVENMEVTDHYEDIKKIYDDFLENSNMLDLIDVYKKCRILTSNCENNNTICPSQLLDFLSGKQYAVGDETDLSIPTSPTSKYNQDNEKVQLLARKIIFSYLNLLVNSKNDLAVAHILNIPDRGLGREAFTDLKHAAREKQMSIFLVWMCDMFKIKTPCTVDPWILICL
ncbi:PREDICTED: PCNA-interacting partner isoform X4 [Rhinopithecus bieti]|uniref:PCNA-interacting partner isoform X4 n=1 Tax=Rhinopithecus bieti TaxID=61621 RepID=UPI00083C4AA1|nr:PREDICTED: PCNA-interacting partner isoform X4 [Rhinopithecus bieti]